MKSYKNFKRLTQVFGEADKHGIRLGALPAQHRLVNEHAASNAVCSGQTCIKIL